MSAEFILSFNYFSWYENNKYNIVQVISSLPSYWKNDGAIYYLSCDINKENYSVRLFIEDKSLFIEISTRPEIIQNDLNYLFSWIRCRTRIKIYDHDGEESGW